MARTHFADCRVHHRPWDVLRLTRMPAIQVEMGYLSNPAERDRLTSDEFRNLLADGLLVAVKRLYLDGRDDPHTGTFTFSDLLAHERTHPRLGLIGPRTGAAAPCQAVAIGTLAPTSSGTTGDGDAGTVITANSFSSADSTSAFQPMSRPSSKRSRG